jgi:hypothetical protein
VIFSWGSDALSLLGNFTGDSFYGAMLHETTSTGKRHDFML